MHNVQAELLQDFAARVFIAHGTRPADANTVAQMLTKASLLGHDSHGLIRIARYVEKIRQGTLHPAAQPSVKEYHGATAIVDGAMGFGQLAGNLGVEVARKLAHENGVAAVSLSRTNHLGRIGDYAEQLAAAGFVALILASGAGPGGSVAPHGGRERILGTNPLAWAVPVPNERGPLVADFSTSGIPEGRVGMALAKAEPLPSGSILAVDGRPSVDPADFYAGGALLPFGGHKGSSLVLLIEIVASLLGGSVPSSSTAYRPGNPAVIIALNVATFLPLADYLKHTGNLLQRIESSAPANEGGRVRIPNSIELETMATRQKEGIPLPESLRKELELLGREAGVPWQE
jgi:LDH2 family malate/lactate/ureidoglycolate dehydrogenase